MHDLGGREPGAGEEKTQGRHDDESAAYAEQARKHSGTGTGYEVGEEVFHVAGVSGDGIVD